MLIAVQLYKSKKLAQKEGKKNSAQYSCNFFPTCAVCLIKCRGEVMSRGQKKKSIHFRTQEEKAVFKRGFVVIYFLLLQLSSPTLLFKTTDNKVKAGMGSVMTRHGCAAG